MTGSEDKLVRSIGRWTLAGLVLNGIIGSGVYGLPSIIGGKLGDRAWIAWVIAAAAVGVVVACFAEVASRFGKAGGQYLYARVAFGPYLGMQMGWMTYLVRLTSVATNVNLLTIYLAEFVPAAGKGFGPALVATVFLASLAWLNVRGLKQATGAANFLIVAKIVPLVAFAVVGLGLTMGGSTAASDPVGPIGVRTWVESILLLFFAYGGFESAMLPLGEAKRPERDAPFALFVGLAGVAAIYLSVQVVSTLALPDLPTHQRPLADAARSLVGPAGATFMAVGAVLSLVGWGLGTMILTPRLTYSMAEHGDLPAVFGSVHPRFRTPAFSIVACAVFSLALTLSGSFLQNLTIAAVSRLFTYALVCLSLPVLRARDGTDPDLPPARFRLPFGTGFAVLGVLFSLTLATRMTVREAVILAVVVAAGTVAYLVRRKR